MLYGIKIHRPSVRTVISRLVSFFKDEALFYTKMFRCRDLLSKSQSENFLVNINRRIEINVHMHSLGQYMIHLNTKIGLIFGAHLNMN